MNEDPAETFRAQSIDVSNYAVDRYVPDEVCTPSNVLELSECLADAHANKRATILCGNRSKIDWGRPPTRFELAIDNSKLSRLIEHAASDLVVRVSASTNLDELQAVLAESEQRLAIDTVVPNSSIGGVIATGISGPLRYGFGAVRDLIIGVTVLRPDGVRATSGGRVVKNVAGYDLAKLYTGSYGTLGAITEAYFRLHALPEYSRYVLARLALPSAGQVLEGLLRAPLALAGIEFNFHTDGTNLTVGVLVEGRQESVEVRASIAASLLGSNAEISEDRPRWWGQLPGSTTFKMATEIAKVTEMLRHIQQIAEHYDQPLQAIGSAGVGVFFVGGDLPITEGTDRTIALVSAVRQASIGAGGSTVVLRAPLEVRTVVDVWGPIPALGIMRRVKQEFDPAGILAAGRFVGGI